MPRRRCCGLIDDFPVCKKFLPQPPNEHGAVILTFEELEAIRLKDLLGLEQTECAAAMKLSRPTYQRILQNARTKLALALVEGRGINIEGGNYIMNNRVFQCMDCNHIYEVEPCSAGGKHGYELSCPQCGSMKKMKLANGQLHACNHDGSRETPGSGGCGCGSH